MAYKMGKKSLKGSGQYGGKVRKTKPKRTRRF